MAIRETSCPRSSHYFNVVVDGYHLNHRLIPVHQKPRYTFHSASRRRGTIKLDIVLRNGQNIMVGAG